MLTVGGTYQFLTSSEEDVLSSVHMRSEDGQMKHHRESNVVHLEASSAI
jgi:hypothetical protein